MFKINIQIIFSVLLLITVCGCSFFAPYKQSINIDGTPADATVVVNGTKYVAPVKIDVPRNKNLSIIIHKEGFNVQKINSGYSLSAIGAVDAAGCWLLLLPGIGLLSPGAWELNEDNFYYTLSPAEKPANINQ